MPNSSTKRTMPKGKGSQQPKRGLPPGVKSHKFARTRDFGVISKAALDSGGSLQFTMDQVPEYAELTTLYDAYSIDKVEVKFVYYRPFSNSTLTSGEHPTMMITHDYDDANPPTTMTEVGAYSDARVFPFNWATPVHNIVVRPRAAKLMYKGVTSGYSWAEESAVIDAGNVDVPHYGLKWFINQFNTTNNNLSEIRMFVKFHITGYAVR